MRTNKTIIATGIATLFFIKGALAHAGNSDYGMMSGGSWFFGMAFLGWFFMVLTATVFILLIIWLFRQIENSARSRK